MIKKTPINEKVKDVLDRRIKAINRLNTETGKPFFLGTSLEPQDRTNPLEQHLYRNCFAKVAVMNEIPNDDEVRFTKPRYLSSYMNLSSNEETGIDSISQIDKPLAFYQDSKESKDNRFRGHSGITSISVDQQEYFTYKFTINWTCPDPVYFEKEFEPFFLQLGAFCSIEFGWGINDRGIKIPDINIEEMKDLLKGIEKRNLESAGNYYCNIGVVTKFDWKVNADGTYTGNIVCMSPSANVLGETTDESGGTSSEANIAKVKKLQEKVALGKNLLSSSELSTEQKTELLTTQAEISQLLFELQSNGITFQNSIKNLDKVVDSYMGLVDLPNELPNFSDVDSIGSGIVATLNTVLLGLLDWTQLDQGITRGIEKLVESIKDRTSRLTFRESPYDLSSVLNPDLTQSEIDYLFRDGAIRITPISRYLKPNDSTPEKMKKRYFMSWGWFEDIILSTFFEMNSGDDIIQEVYSATSAGDGSGDELNLCQTNPFLYSTGLDYTILPGKMNPALSTGFNNFTEDEKRKASKLYTKEQRNNMARVYHMYKIIDEQFKSFEINTATGKELSEEKSQDGLKVNSKGQRYYIDKETDKAVIIPNSKVKGVIRNMVFPMELYQKHFGSMASLKTAMTNFWSDVNNQYGGYWDFKIGQDQDKTQRIGVSDLYTGEEPGDDIFVFPLYSKDSIIKTFDINLDLSSEAATLARYGTYSKKDNNKKVDGKKDIGILAWSYLSSADYNVNRDKKSLEDQKLDKFRNMEVYKDIAYPNDKGKSKKYIDKYSTDPLIPRALNNDGFDFGSISLVKEDDEKQLEKIENNTVGFIKGVGCYDKYGNLSGYFKSTMNYILNTATERNSESNIVRATPLIPVKLSMELDGLGGLRVGNLFRVDYLPARYREHVYFMITKVNHSISKDGWSTSIDALMVGDMPSFWKDNETSQNPEVNYDELFKLTTITGLEDYLKTLGEIPEKANKRIKKFEKQLQDIDNALGKWKDSRPIRLAKRAFNYSRIEANVIHARKLYRKIERSLSDIEVDVYKDTLTKITKMFNDKMDTILSAKGKDGLTMEQYASIRTGTAFDLTPASFLFRKIEPDLPTESGGGGGGAG